METEDNNWGRNSSSDRDQTFTSILDYEIDIDPCLQVNVGDPLQGIRAQAWDPKTMLNNLSFMEDKVHQLQDLVHLLAGRGGQPQEDDLVAADLNSIIIQLISTAGSLLPSLKHNMSTQPGSAMFPYPREPNNVASQNPNYTREFDLPKPGHVVEEHEMKDEDDVEDGEHLPPGSYEILQLEKEEILAPHSHFCTICGKGFKRDANLRMHMRGHGEEYKTPAALAKPNKESVSGSGSEPMLIKRYSCPFPGCKRNKDHKKFQPLKTILCVKNHYKRTHCDKSFTCGRCHTKKFSVIADLKTHEKHCGKNKWLCSCGTTFSRKDKLFGHIALFQGHTPAIPPEETNPSAQIGSSDCGNNNQGMVGFDLGSSSNANTETAQPGIMGERIGFEGSFSPLSFDTCNFGGFHEFPRPMFDDSECSLQMLIASACGFSPRNSDGSLSNTNTNLF